jgi:hypothetical protein
MSIYKVGEMGERRTAAMDEKGVRTYTARDHADVPDMFDSYVTDTSIDTQALVISKSARETPDNPFRWEVEVNYSSAAEDPEQAAENPLDRPAIYKWTSEASKDPLQEDTEGNAVTNSADMPFDPLPEVDVANRILTIVRNEETFDPDDKDQYTYTLNQNEIFNQPAGQGRLEPIEGEEQFENGIKFWRVTYTIKFRKQPKTWQIWLLDQGPCELIDDEWVKVIDKNGTEVGVVNLDGEGRKIDPAEDDPTYFGFYGYEEADWDPLDLESDYPG